MPRRSAVLLAIVCGLLALAFATAASPASALDGKSLAAALEKRTATFGSRSGALVRDLTTGKTLYERRRGLGLAPASNEKLYTTAAAILKYGPNAKLTTTLRVAPGAVPDEDGVIDGDVILVGAGDPGFNDDAIRNLVGDLKKLGVKRITGEIKGDGRRFDSKPGSYDTNYRPDSELGGWLGGLTWGHGRVDGFGPAQYAASRLRYLLELNKIDVKGGAHSGYAQGTTKRIAAVGSQPIRSIIATTNVPSDNFYAETLAKDLGASFGDGGTTPEGTHVIRDTLADFGIHPRIFDGSGLSRKNNTSPSQIVTLLTKMAEHEDGAIWRASLPQPGVSGTLAKRMRGTAAVNRCRAKTGTLHDVSALSGYCNVPGGHVLAFSFLSNRIDPYYVKSVEDQMVPMIASYSPPDD